jgi:hypothetical protein
MDRVRAWFYSIIWPWLRLKAYRILLRKRDAEIVYLTDLSSTLKEAVDHQRKLAQEAERVSRQRMEREEQWKKERDGLLVSLGIQKKAIQARQDMLDKLFSSVEFVHIELQRARLL